jgi:hypothetical protein
MKVTELEPEALISFMHDQPTCLPPMVEHWAELARSGDA